MFFVGCLWLYTSHGPCTMHARTIQCAILVLSAFEFLALVLVTTTRYLCGKKLSSCAFQQVSTTITMHMEVYGSCKPILQQHLPEP